MKPTLDEREFRIWVQSPRPEYRRQTQHYNLPCRCIGLLRPKKDMIVLPGSYEPCTEFWEFSKELLGYEDWQCVFTSGSNSVLDMDIVDNVMDSIVEFCKSRLEEDPESTLAIYPYSATDTFQRWHDEIIEKEPSLKFRVFGDSVEWVKEKGHKGILHRRIDSLDVPCLVEGLNVRVPLGYTCSTTDELLEAYDRLKGIPVILKPVLGAAGEGILFIENAGELREYDFPMGDVALEERLNLDRAPDGIVLAPAFHYVAHSQCGDLVDQIMLGTTYFGWRKSNASAEFLSDAMRQANEVVEFLDPKGPGGFDFLSQDGLPYLTDINTGRMNGAHFPKLFMEQHAPGKKFYCWKFKPREGMTVWTFWNLLVDQDIAFIPGNSDRGVFPIIFLKGLSAQFLAISDNEEDLMDIYHKADQILRDYTHDDIDVVDISFAKLRSPEFARIWAHSPTAQQRKDWHRVTLPSRPIPLMRPGADRVVLPGGDEGVTKFWEFCRDVLGLEDSQAIFTDPKNLPLDEEILLDETTLSVLRSVVTLSDTKYVLVPFTMSPHFQKWASELEQLGAHMFGETLEFMDRFGSKSILHRHIQHPDTPSVLEVLVRDSTVRIRVPRGFVCETCEDLLLAYRTIGSSTVVIKPVNGEDGEGILFVSDPAELSFYDFPYGTVLLEEKLEIDRDPSGVLVSPATYFLEGHVFDGVVDQIILGRRCVGWRKYAGRKSIKENIQQRSNTLIKKMGAQCAGGFDFVTSGGKSFLIDNNLGRFNASHFARLFRESYSPQCDFVVWNYTPPASLDIFEFWKALEEAGIDLTPGTKSFGIFPLLYLPSVAGTFIACAESPAQADHMKEVVSQLFAASRLAASHSH